jgi:acetoin utilization deacetylase AcuC-like enzyme
MLPFKLIYSEKYYLPIGEHIFRADKYRFVRERLLQTGTAGEDDFLAPQPATENDLLLVHSPRYVNKLMEGGLTAREELELEIPYSPEVVDAFLLHTGGSVLAAEQALKAGVSINLGGGFHHAFPEHGEGFCMINDIAIAIRTMQKRAALGRAMTIDCDVHQGNGTAAIFGSAAARPNPLPSSTPTSARPAPGGDPGPGSAAAGFAAAPGAVMTEGPSKDVFTISLHQEKNYPFIKPPSSIDVNLPDGCGDTEYLGWLDNALSSGLRRFEPELISYVAGADPYCEDQLGGLNLTLEGLKRRDELVFRAARAHNIPVMVTLAGGYARNFDDTITIHCNTVRAAAEAWQTTAPRM